MIVIVAEIVVPPPQLDQLLAAAGVHAIRSRGEPGCEFYELLVDPATPGRIVFTEGWHDDAALKAHQKAPGSQAFGQEAGRIEGLRMKARVFDAEQRGAKPPAPPTTP